MYARDQLGWVVAILLAWGVGWEGKRGNEALELEVTPLTGQFFSWVLGVALGSSA